MISGFYAECFGCDWWDRIECCARPTADPDDLYCPDCGRHIDATWHESEQQRCE